MNFVDDSFREFGLDVERVAPGNIPGIPEKAWGLLKGQITL